MISCQPSLKAALVYFSKSGSLKLPRLDIDLTDVGNLKLEVDIDFAHFKSHALFCPQDGCPHVWLGWCDNDISSDWSLYDPEVLFGIA